MIVRHVWHLLRDAIIANALLLILSPDPPPPPPILHPPAAAYSLRYDSVALAWLTGMTNISAMLLSCPPRASAHVLTPAQPRSRRNSHVRLPARGKHNVLGNVLGDERLEALVHVLGGIFVAAEARDRERCGVGGGER